MSNRNVNVSPGVPTNGVLPTTAEELLDRASGWFIETTSPLTLVMINSPCDELRVVETDGF
jgi:hypothetical protein